MMMMMKMIRMMMMMEDYMQPGRTDVTEEGSDDQDTESSMSIDTLPPSPVCQESSSPSTQLNSPENTSSHPGLLEAIKSPIVKTVSRALLDSTQDVDETFVKQVVSKIKQIKDPATKIQLRQNILTMILDAQDAEWKASSCPVL
ncbi:hypothetical protein NFI96_019825 [Prochilodus magdalenae]|nr:hypothetical protein NFI96_019825 [Prochilodus magdalenae]